MPNWIRRLNGGALFFVAATLLHAGVPVPAWAKPRTHTIVIEAMQFSPNTLEVNAGDTVVWVNKDAFPHNATATDHAFKSRDIAPNASWKFTPTRKGSFSYMCTLHPTMKARLVVK